MKHIRTYEKYYDKLLKKYLIIKPWFNPRFDQTHLIILQILDVKDNDDEIHIKFQKLYRYDATMTEPTLITNCGNEANYYFNMEKEIIFQSDSLEECLEKMTLLLDINKFNI